MSNQDFGLCDRRFPQLLPRYFVGPLGQSRAQRRYSRLVSVSVTIIEELSVKVCKFFCRKVSTSNIILIMSHSLFCLYFVVILACVTGFTLTVQQKSSTRLNAGGFGKSAAKKLETTLAPIRGDCPITIEVHSLSQLTARVMGVFITSRFSFALKKA